ncbi:hypothetical protein P8452_20251 [Trifolium repens]|nr:hypothetical protein P8452_20251 [Trifolium repens]
MERESPINFLLSQLSRSSSSSSAAGVQKNMNSAVARCLSSLFRQSHCATEPFSAQLQQCRCIRVHVYNGNLEGALALMLRKMTSSGIERMIKTEQRFHIKYSEKRVLAQKNLERRLRSEDLARKLKAIMIKKVRGL